MQLQYESDMYLIGNLILIKPAYWIWYDSMDSTWIYKFDPIRSSHKSLFHWSCPNGSQSLSVAQKTAAKGRILRDSAVGPNISIKSKRMAKNNTRKPTNKTKEHIELDRLDLQAIRKPTTALRKPKDNKKQFSYVFMDLSWTWTETKNINKNRDSGTLEILELDPTRKPKKVWWGTRVPCIEMVHVLSIFFHLSFWNLDYCCMCFTHTGILQCIHVNI